MMPELLDNVRYQLNNNGSIIRVQWIQDGAPCHQARMVRDRLQYLLRGRVVAIGHDREFPPALQIEHHWTFSCGTG